MNNSFYIPNKENIKKIKEIANETMAISSDMSFINIYLLQKKYSIKVAFMDGFLVRKYTSPIKELGRDGITFPIGKKNPKDLLKRLFKEAKEVCGYLKLCLVNELQKDFICSLFENVKVIKYDGDSDYIYSAKDLAHLPGRKFHKKKNHISKFKRTYGEYEFVVIDKNETKEELEKIRDVEERWIKEQEEVLHSMLVEKYEIERLIDEWNDFSPVAGILQVNKKPVAMSVASQISKNVFDIHFEKSYGEYAKNGAYAVINQEMAKYLSEKKSALFLNREEDIGDAGLRKAKLSYNPINILDKYTVIIM